MHGFIVAGRNNLLGWRKTKLLSPLCNAGCSPQACAYRDHYADLTALGVSAVYGISPQDTGYQAEAQKRLHLPFPLLSDSSLQLTQALKLPTFKVAPCTAAQNTKPFELTLSGAMLCQQEHWGCFKDALLLIAAASHLQGNCTLDLVKRCLIVEVTLTASSYFAPGSADASMFTADVHRPR